MSKRKQYPSQARLRELFDYDPEGFLVWKWRLQDNAASYRKGLAGKLAGCVHTGKDLTVNHLIGVDGHVYPLPRIIWIFHKGGIGKDKNIFHKDGNVSNNKIENLYKTKEKKPRNSSYQRYSRTQSGYIGVYMRNGAWRARLGNLSIGTYTKPEAAAAAYNSHALAAYGDSASLNDVVCPDFENYRHTLSDSLVNRHNSERFTGVYRKGKTYAAYGFGVFIGAFSTEKAAAAAYNFFYKKRWGVAGPNDVEDIDFESFRTRKKPGMGSVRSSTGLKGVVAVKRKTGDAYSARMMIGKKYATIGTFGTKEQAARAYNIAAYEHYGEHAVLNDIPDPLGKGDIF